MALDSPRPRSNGRALTAARLALALLIPALPAAGQEASPAPDHLRYGFTGSTPWTRSRDASG
jgi:hypothetical protein